MLWSILYFMGYDRNCLRNFYFYDICECGISVVIVIM